MRCHVVLGYPEKNYAITFSGFYSVPFDDVQKSVIGGLKISIILVNIPGTSGQSSGVSFRETILSNSDPEKLVE